MSTNTNHMHRFNILYLSLLCGGCSATLTEYPTVPVTGRVTCQGEPLAHVQVYFSPQSQSDQVEVGKAGWGQADAQGRFTLSTYGEQDGAIVGEHSVSVGPPNEERYPGFECNCLTDSNHAVKTVTVTAAGENTIEIELPARTGAAQPPSQQAND